MLSELWARLRGTVRRDGLDREMDEEFRYHLDRATQRNLDRGMPPEAARREALRQFGGVERFKEAGRDEQRSRPLEGLLQDVRYGLRSLRRQPGFALAAILTMALGIGANTAIFSVADTVLLKPLPFPDPDRIVYIGWQYDSGSTIDALAPYQFDHFRAAVPALEGVATYRTFERDLGEPERGATVRGIRVTGDFFRVTAVQPSLGRPFAGDELGPDVAPVAIVSDGLWHREFGGDPDILGREVRLAGTSYTVVGVMPPDFRFPDAGGSTDVLLPMHIDPDPRDEGQNFQVMARLREGVSREVARQQIAAASVSLRERVRVPSTKGDARGVLRESSEIHGQDLRAVLWILLGAVGCVLLIACANAANLLLARASGRTREIAVRFSIGAGRGRVIRQLVTESVVLSLIAGVVGLLVGLVALRTVLPLVPTELPRVDEIALDLRALAFTFGLATLTGLAFGAAAALPATRTSLASALRTGGRGLGPGGHRVREVLVVIETALAIILLAGAGLLATSLARLRSVDPGFEAAGVRTVRMARMPADLEGDRLARWEDDVLQRVRALPGVTDAAFASNFPLERGINIPVTVEGRPETAQGSVEWRSVSPDYFATLRIPIFRGHAFDGSHAAGTPRVALVNEAYARRNWPDSDPIGQRIQIGRWNDRWIAPGFEGAFEVIGVVADIREIGLRRDPRETVYVAQAQMTLSSPHLMVRTGPGARVSNADLVEAVRAPDPRVPPPEAGSLSDVVRASLAEEWFQTTLLGAFALTALLLTAVGLYGVISYGVHQQAHDIVIRMALGARARAVVSAIIGRGLLLVGIGAALGVAGAFALTRLLSATLYGVSATDPVTFAAAVAILLLVAVAAALIPARRAAAMTPREVLQND